MNANEFWTWFETQATRFLSIRDMPDDAMLDEFQTRLHAYCGDLWFEMGGAPEGPMELIISAEGNEAYFPQVLQLVAVAPSIPGWHVIAFKPAHGFDFVTDYEGVELNPETCWFLPLTSDREPGRVALRVAVPDFDSASTASIENGLYIVAQTGLGELVAGQRITFIEACEIPAEPEQDGYIPLCELGNWMASFSRQQDA